ncbi:MAG TPA: DUF3006 domain-containing protein [Clostridia bacterium]|nr:DUF3006 domain-containing protein [Clostridia bacterium]
MLIVDRKEGECVICTDDAGVSIVLDSASILQPVKEGDVLTEAEGGYVVDGAATAHRRQLMRRRLNSLFEK